VLAVLGVDGAVHVVRGALGAAVAGFVAEQWHMLVGTIGSSSVVGRGSAAVAADGASVGAVTLSVVVKVGNSVVADTKAYDDGDDSGTDNTLVAQQVLEHPLAPCCGASFEGRPSLVRLTAYLPLRQNRNARYLLDRTHFRLYWTLDFRRKLG